MEAVMCFYRDLGSLSAMISLRVRFDMGEVIRQLPEMHGYYNVSLAITDGKELVCGVSSSKVKIEKRGDGSLSRVILELDPKCKRSLSRQEILIAFGAIIRDEIVAVFAGNTTGRLDRLTNVFVTTGVDSIPGIEYNVTSGKFWELSDFGNRAAQEKPYTGPVKIEHDLNPVIDLYGFKNCSKIDFKLIDFSTHEDVCKQTIRVTLGKMHGSIRCKEELFKSRMKVAALTLHCSHGQSVILYGKLSDKFSIESLVPVSVNANLDFGPYRDHVPMDKGTFLLINVRNAKGDVVCGRIYKPPQGHKKSRHNIDVSIPCFKPLGGYGYLIESTIYKRAEFIAWIVSTMTARKPGKWVIDDTEAYGRKLNLLKPVTSVSWLGLVSTTAILSALALCLSLTLAYLCRRYRILRETMELEK